MVKSTSPKLEALAEDTWFADLSASIAEQQSPAETDGRRLRRALNREAVVDALLDLYEEGNLRPSTDEIADRAGISPRSLFRYFEDTDDLAQEAVSRQQARTLPLVVLDVPADTPLDRRIEAIVDQRFHLFGTKRSAATVLRLRAPFNPSLAQILRNSRLFLRSQVRTLFAPELAVMEEGQAEAVLAAVDVLLSFECQEIHRDTEEASTEGSKELVTTALRTLLTVRP